MKKTLSLIFLTLVLTSCSLVRVHKLDIEQGNITTPDQINQLHPGMSEEKVKDILGTPLLINTFDDNRIEYLYSFKPSYGEPIEKVVTLIFRNHILKEVRMNVYSQSTGP